jgi:hypothetical protein
MTPPPWRRWASRSVSVQYRVWHSPLPPKPTSPPTPTPTPTPAPTPSGAGLQVGLTVLQYLVWQVQAQAAKNPSAQAGPTEAAVAQKLAGIVRAAAASEALGPDQREWCRRVPARGGRVSSGGRAAVWAPIGVGACTGQAVAW